MELHTLRQRVVSPFRMTISTRRLTEHLAASSLLARGRTGDGRGRYPRANSLCNPERLWTTRFTLIQHRETAQRFPTHVRASSPRFWLRSETSPNPGCANTTRTVSAAH